MMTNECCSSSQKMAMLYLLMYMKAHSAITHLLKGNLLKLIDVVVDQDAKILSKIYANTPQQIKLHNEVEMDWVRRNAREFSSSR